MVMRGDQHYGASIIHRRLLFLSHATPEDNVFATWLSSQLAIAGYEVWCDVTQLLGGERFWDDIEEAIDQATFRFLFVSTLEANTKPGTLRELKLAEEARDKHGLGDFIVPLKIDSFPFESMRQGLTDLNIMRFDAGWADGLRDLLKLLEREGAPKSESANAGAVKAWHTRSIKNDRKKVRSNDPYLSNWFKLRLPRSLFAHKFRGPAANLEKVAQAFPHPGRVVGQRLITFAPLDAVTLSIGDVWSHDETVRLETDQFIADGSRVLEIARFDASNIVTDLIQQAWHIEMTRRELGEFPLASGLVARFFTDQQLERNKAHFTPVRGKPTYRQLVGTKSKYTADGAKVRDGYWHFALSASTQLDPFPRVVLRHHVIFSDDGRTPWDKPERMHKARRKVCKQWWNPAWRDRLLAFTAQLADDEGKLELRTGGDPIAVTMKPERFVSPITFYEDGQVGLNEAEDTELIETAEDDDDEEPDGSAAQ